MPKYLAKAQADFVWFPDEYVEERHGTIVVHDSADAKFTGILNSEGHPIFRLKEPMGFRIRKNE